MSESTTPAVEKQCRRCGEVKPADAFHRERTSKDGLRSSCRNCTHEQQREWRERNREYNIERSRQYRAENLEVRRQKEREYNDAHREERRASDRKYHAEHRDERSAYQAVYREANQEVLLQQARERGAAARKAVFDHYGQACACCGTSERLTIDHINGDGREHREAIGRNAGTSTYRWLIQNGFPDVGLQVLCVWCNTSKHTTDRCRLDHS